MSPARSCRRSALGGGLNFGPPIFGGGLGRSRGAEHSAQPAKKGQRGLGGRSEVLLQGPAAGAARLESMLSVLDPGDLDGRAQWPPWDLVAVAERIPGPLADQRRGHELDQMRDAQSLGLAGRVKWVAETDQADRGRCVRDQACDPPAQRLATDTGDSWLMNAALVSIEVSDLRPAAMRPARSGWSAVGRGRSASGAIR